MSYDAESQVRAVRCLKVQELYVPKGLSAQMSKGLKGRSAQRTTTNQPTLLQCDDIL